MNICQHRAYNGSNLPAHVYEYADRLEFDNTGNLYGKARPENFPTETDYRNPLISSVMRALGYVNRFGMGIGLGGRLGSSFRADIAIAGQSSGCFALR